MKSEPIINEDIVMKQEVVNENETNRQSQSQSMEIGDENVTNLRNDDSEDDDDPVVKEIQVFISKSLANNIYILQVNI